VDKTLLPGYGSISGRYNPTRSKNNPSDWASPDQRCRAAIKAVGQYGKVISLSSGGKQIQK
jgi:hypothetical protein